MKDGEEQFRSLTIPDGQGEVAKPGKDGEAGDGHGDVSELPPLVLGLHVVGKEGCGGALHEGGTGGVFWVLRVSHPG